MAVEDTYQALQNRPHKLLDAVYEGRVKVFIALLFALTEFLVNCANDHLVDYISFSIRLRNDHISLAESHRGNVTIYRGAFAHYDKEAEMVKKQSGPTEQLRRSNKVMSYGDRLGSRSTDASTLGGVEQPLDTMTDGDNKHKTHRSGQRRIRGNLELGISILQHVEGQLNRADSKAQFTLTLDALLIASSAFLGRGATSDVVRIGATTFSYRIVAVLGIAMFITLLISTIYALVAVIPRFTPENMANNNIFYFGNIVQQERKDFAEHYFSQSNREIERMLMSEIHDLAGIAKQKFALIRISYIFLFASLGFWSIVQMIILLIR